MTVRYGVSTLFALGDPFPLLIKRLARWSPRVRHWEVFDDGGQSINPHRARLLRRLARQHDVTFSVHAPMADVNIASLNRELRGPILQRLFDSLDNASTLEATAWVLHPGVHTGLSWVYPGEDWKLNIEGMSRLVDHARNVQVLVENISAPSALLRHPDDFVRFFKELGSRPRITLDIGHSHINRETQILLQRFQEDIVHVHAHDNDGREDQHLPIGQGTFPWKKLRRLIAANHFNGTVIVESASGPLVSLSRLRGFLGATQ